MEHDPSAESERVEFLRWSEAEEKWNERGMTAKRNKENDQSETAFVPVICQNQ